MQAHNIWLSAKWTSSLLAYFITWAPVPAKSALSGLIPALSCQFFFFFKAQSQVEIFRQGVASPQETQSIYPLQGTAHHTSCCHQWEAVRNFLINIIGYKYFQQKTLQLCLILQPYRNQTLSYEKKVEVKGSPEKHRWSPWWSYLKEVWEPLV